MASEGKMAQNEKRKRLVALWAERRAEYKAIIKDPRRSIEERDEAMRKLQAIPRNASPVRVRNRCSVTGRARGYYRKFGISRIAIRDLGLTGQLPGVRKSSW